MKQLLILVYFGIAVYAKPSHHHYNDVYPVNPGVGAIYKGPNSETIIEGPDGSVITSEADGGAVAVKGESVAVEAVSHAASQAVAQQTVVSQAVAHQAVAHQAATHQAAAHQAAAYQAAAHQAAAHQAAAHQAAAHQAAAHQAAAHQAAAYQAAAHQAAAHQAAAHQAAVHQAAAHQAAAHQAAAYQAAAHQAAAHQAAAQQAVAHQAAAYQAAAHQAVSHQAASASASAYAESNVVAAQGPVVVAEPVVVPVTNPQVVLVQESKDTAALDGPSGSILRHGEDAVISGPSSVTIRDGKHVVDIQNVEVKTAEVNSGPVGAVVAPASVLVDASPSVVPIVSSTPGPILVDASVRPLHPRPVLIDAPHPLKPLAEPVPVLVDDTHLTGSTLGTSGPIVVEDLSLAQKQLLLSTAGASSHDSASVSIQNEIVSHGAVSSTSVPVINGAPIVVASSKADISPPAIDLRPPLVHSSVGVSSTPASHIANYIKDEAISAAIAKNAEAQQSYLSGLQYANYEKAVAAEAERKSLEAAVQLSGAYAGHGLVDKTSLSPVVSQGNHIISGGIVSSTPVPLGVVSSTPSPVLVTSLAPAQSTVISSAKNLVAVGPQVFQANGIVAVTPKPGVVISSTPIPQAVPVNLVSSTIHPEGLDHSGPIVSRPTAVLAATGHEDLGQVVVQSKTVSASESSSHSSSVHSSSSTGVITDPVSLGHGHRLPGRPPLGGHHLSEYGEWQQSVAKQGYAAHQRFLH